MKRSVASLGLQLLVAVSLLCGVAGTASANHLHYIHIVDPRYAPLIADAVADPEIPLEQWVIYTGDTSSNTLISGDGLTTTFIRPAGAPIPQTVVVFDFPEFADVTNPKVTGFWEFEVSSLTFTNSPSIDFGLTDLANNIQWDESAGEIQSTKLGTKLTGLSRWSGFPLRIRVYYNFADSVVTFVRVGSETDSWDLGGEPFQDFFGDVEGTDPDNLDIYAFVRCDVNCTVKALDWGMMDCDVVAGGIDVGNCIRLGVVGNGIIDPGETCDDGNTVPGDGCDQNGQLEKIGWKCQEAIGKAGRLYAKARLKLLQKCRNRLNRGATLFQDKAKTLAITDRSECPNEFKTAGKLVKVEEKVRKLVAGKCTDTLVGALGLCSNTVDGLVSSDGTAGCLIQTHDAAVDTLLTAQYGG